MGLGIVIFIIIIGITAYLARKGRQKNKSTYTVPQNIGQLLAENVAFYKELKEDDKARFEARVKDFLSNITIQGVGVDIEDLDKVLVAAGGIIPIFAFPDWKYNNLNEVLLYPDTFNTDYRTAGTERNVLGMVGDGAMNREMILSLPSLRASFKNAADGHNTAIHEFAHLLDKADGATDGIPEYLLARPYILPWVSKMHETIKQMQLKNKSDINLYGATNDAEFFAVLTEYLFERPEELKTKHPELFRMLEEMYHVAKTNKD